MSEFNCVGEQLGTPRVTVFVVEALSLLRLRQWIKNAFVFAPLIFSRTFTDPAADLRSLLTFAVFCLASSAGYIVNDIFDINADRLHPVKRASRPLARGALTVNQAIVILGIITLLLVLILAGVPSVVPGALAYLILTVSYSWKLKHIVVVDLFAIASGFVIRVYVGAVAIGVRLSFWMFITTLCLALYLASTKRRQELLASGSGARGTLERYSVQLLNHYALASWICAMIFYGLYVATINSNLIITIIPVLFGLFRYQYLVEMAGDGESPSDVVWKDPVLATTIAFWALSALYLLRMP